ncbi:MAG: MBL fold metallo-hydrolase [Chloroflexota bacterium]
MSEPIRIEMPTPFSVGPVNAFLFLEPEPVLVDCGQKMEMSRTALEKGLDKHGLKFTDIKRVILTHAHVDHVGMAGDFAAEANAMVWASELTYDWVHRVDEVWQARVDVMEESLVLGGAPEDDQKIAVAYMRQMPQLWSAVPAKNLVRFPIDGELTFGGHVWQVIHAPGHTRTQTCFFQPETGWLLSADMLLHKSPAPVIESDGNGKRIPGLVEHVESMERFKALEISKIFPGHGPIMDDHRGLIERQLARIEVRRDECFDLVAAGHETVFAITEQMYTHLPQGARGVGFGMVIGYLDLLIDAGRVSRDVVDGVWRFSAA